MINLKPKVIEELLIGLFLGYASFLIAYLITWMYIPKSIFLLVTLIIGMVEVILLVLLFWKKSSTNAKDALLELQEELEHLKAIR